MAVFSHFGKRKQSAYARHPNDVGNVDHLALGKLRGSCFMEDRIGAFSSLHVMADEQKTGAHRIKGKCLFMLISCLEGCNGLTRFVGSR